MAVTKKDFVAIAQIIRQELSNIQDTKPTGVTVIDIANNLALYFKKQNALFSKYKFLKSCGVIR